MCFDRWIQRGSKTIETWPRPAQMEFVRISSEWAGRRAQVRPFPEQWSVWSVQGRENRPLTLPDVYFWWIYLTCWRQIYARSYDLPYVNGKLIEFCQFWCWATGRAYDGNISTTICRRHRYFLFICWVKKPWSWWWCRAVGKSKPLIFLICTLAYIYL